MSSFDWNHTTVQRLVARYVELNRKATPQDAEQSRVVREVAEYYAANYDGSFKFMIKMRGVMLNFNKLSVGQASGVINCMMVEYRKLQATPVVKPTFTYPTAELPNLPAEIAANKAAEQAATASKVSIREVALRATCSRCGELTDVSYDTSLTATCVDKAACDARCSTPVAQACKNGTYTVVLDETGTYRTVKLSDAPDHFNKPQGTQIAAYLSGSDNESNYTGFAFITGTRINVWSRITAKTSEPLVRALRVLLASDKETQHDMGHAYAIESGNCFLCSRKLTVPASVARGLGPICAEKY